MSDKAMDALVKGLESDQTPNDQTSQTGANNSSPGDSDVSLDALVSKLAEDPKLQEAILKIAQSGKDKGIASAKKDAKEAKDLATEARSTVAKFQDYLKKYGDEDRAFFEMERDEKIDSLLNGNAPATQGSASAGTDSRPWGVRQNEILNSANIDTTDPRVKEFAIEMRDKGSSPEDYLAGLQSKTFEWAQADIDKPKPNSSTIANPVQGKKLIAKIDKADSEELGAELLALGVDYSANAARIKEIRQELERRDQGAK